jgi:hypothetical protein
MRQREERLRDDLRDLVAGVTGVIQIEIRRALAVNGEDLEMGVGAVDETHADIPRRVAAVEEGVAELEAQGR